MMSPNIGHCHPTLAHHCHLSQMSKMFFSLSLFACFQYKPDILSLIQLDHFVFVTVMTLLTGHLPKKTNNKTLITKK